MISYERYTELLSKLINRTITPSEEKDIAKFQAAQPKLCPSAMPPSGVSLPRHGWSTTLKNVRQKLPEA